MHRRHNTSTIQAVPTRAKQLQELLVAASEAEPRQQHQRQRVLLDLSPRQEGTMPPGVSVAPGQTDTGLVPSLAPAPEKHKCITTVQGDLMLAGVADREQGHQTGMLHSQAKKLSAAYEELCATVLAVSKTYKQQYKEMCNKTSAQRCLDGLALSGDNPIQAAAHVDSLTQLHARCEEPDHKRIREQLLKIYNVASQRAAQASCMQAEMSHASAWTKHQLQQQLLKGHSDLNKLMDYLGMLQRAAQRCLKQQLEAYSKATAGYFRQVRLKGEANHQALHQPSLAGAIAAGQPEAGVIRTHPSELPRAPSSKVTPKAPHIVPLGLPQPPAPSQAPPKPSQALPHAPLQPSTIQPQAPPQPPPAPPTSSNISSYDNAPRGLNTSSSSPTPASELPQAPSIGNVASTTGLHGGRSVSQQLTAGQTASKEPSKERRSLKRKAEQVPSEEQPQIKRSARLALRPVTAADQLQHQGAGHFGPTSATESHGMSWIHSSVPAQMGYHGGAVPTPSASKTYNMAPSGLQLPLQQPCTSVHAQSMPHGVQDSMAGGRFTSQESGGSTMCHLAAGAHSLHGSEAVVRQQQRQRAGSVLILLGSLKPKTEEQANAWRADVDVLMEHLPAAPEECDFQPPGLELLMTVEYF